MGISMQQLMTTSFPKRMAECYTSLWPLPQEATSSEHSHRSGYFVGTVQRPCAHMQAIRLFSFAAALEMGCHLATTVFG